MGYPDGSRLFVIIRDQVLLAACVSLESVELRECLVTLVVVRWRDISPSLSLARESRAN